jgi:hypothetical protein
MPWSLAGIPIMSVEKGIVDHEGRLYSLTQIDLVTTAHRLVNQNNKS